MAQEGAVDPSVGSEKFDTIDQPAAQPQHPHERGQTVTNTQDIAEQMAAESVRGEGAADESPQPTAERETQLKSPERVQLEEGRPDEVAQRRREASEEAPTETDDTGEPEAEQPQPEPGTETIEFSQEELEQMVEMGVPIPEGVTEVPGEAAPVINELLQTVLDAETRSVQKEREALELQRRMQDFAQRVQEDPDRVLLSLAFNDPDSFEEAVQRFERAREDDGYRDQLLKELEIEAREEQLNRREEVQEMTEMQRRGQRIKAHTQRALQRHGIPDSAREVVEEAIVNRARRNAEQTGDLDVSREEIESIVSSFGEQIGGPAQGSRPAAKQPETQEREQQAPQQPASERQERPPQKSESGGRQFEESPRSSQTAAQGQSSLESLRNAVFESAERTRGQGF